MNIKRIIIIATAAVLIMVALTACERSASTPPAGSQGVGTTTTAEFPVPGTADDVMAQLEILATQTAIAMQGGAPPTAQPGQAGQPTQAGQAGQPTQAPPASGVTQAPQAAAATPTTAPTQAPAAQVVVPTATPGIPATWTLQTGEFPYCIARRFNVDPNEMLQLSGLSAGATYTAGTVLKIPQTGHPFPGPRALRKHPDTYTAGTNDTIFTIACVYGDADPYAIAYANSLKSPYAIAAGQVLQIP